MPAPALRSRVAFAITVLAVAAAGAAAATPARASVGAVAHIGIIRNGGFNGTSQHWAAMPGTGLAVDGPGQTGTDPYEGSGFAAIDAAASGGGIYQDVPTYVAAGFTFCASARVAPVGAGTAGYFTVWLTGDGSSENSTKPYSLAAGAGWTLVQACATATTFHDDVRVQFYPDVDAPPVGVDTVEAHAALDRNGGFDQSTTGWSTFPGTSIARYGPGQAAADPYDGTGFVAVSTSVSGGSIYQDIARPIPYGASFCASARVTTVGTTGGASGYFTVWLLGGENGPPDSVTTPYSGLGGGNDWRLLQACVSNANGINGHTSIRVQFYPAVGSPVVGIDTVDVHESPIQSGGFNGAGTPVNWVTVNGSTLTAYGPGATGNDPVEGSGFAVTDAVQAGGGIFQQQVVDAAAGDMFCVSAQVVTAGTGSGAGGYLTLWFPDGTPESSTKAYSNLPGGDDWTLIQSCATATASHSVIRVQFYPLVGAPPVAIDAVDLS